MNETKIKLLKNRLQELYSRKWDNYNMIEIELIQKEILRLQKSSYKEELQKRLKKVTENLNRVNMNIINFDPYVPQMFLDFGDQLEKELKEIKQELEACTFEHRQD